MSPTMGILPFASPTTSARRMAFNEMTLEYASLLPMSLVKCPPATIFCLVAQIVLHIVDKMNSDLLIIGWRNRFRSCAAILERTILIKVGNLHCFRIGPLGVTCGFLQTSRVLVVTGYLDPKLVARSCLLLCHPGIDNLALDLLGISGPPIQRCPPISVKKSLFLRIGRHGDLVARNHAIQWHPSLGTVFPLYENVPLGVLPILRLACQRTLMTNDFLKEP